MRWAIFADLSRELSDVERGAVFAAVDEIVPGSGCVGPNRCGDEEVYFAVEAADAEAARVAAAALMDRVIAAAGVTVTYEITVQADSRAR
jgi:hypothetical protein